MPGTSAIVIIVESDRTRESRRWARLPELPNAAADARRSEANSHWRHQNDLMTDPMMLTLSPNRVGRTGPSRTLICTDSELDAASMWSEGPTCLPESCCSRPSTTGSFFRWNPSDKERRYQMVTQRRADGRNPR